ncbi:MAG: aldehyde dehydrogenase (NADP(+)) [Leeuwenhoekiella sp.]
MITGKNQIGYELLAAGETTFKTFDPQTNAETSWDFTEATQEEVDQACKKAAEAFPEFSSISASARASFLRTIATEIENLGDDLITAYTTESGLPEGRAKGERGRTIGQLNKFADLLDQSDWVQASVDTAQPDREPLPKADIRKMLRPIGPVAVFGASNFPLAFSTAGGDTASALASGCPVVVKSHPLHAGTGELVASAIVKAAEKTNMPDGVFSHLNSQDSKVGEWLVKHPVIKGVGFTGSRNGGQALMALGASRSEPIPVFAEMGSINPVVFLPKALSQNGSDWAKKYAGSINLGAGQFCTNPGLLLAIEDDALHTFANNLAMELSEQTATCMLHPKMVKAYDHARQMIMNTEGVEILSINLESKQENNGKPTLVKVAGTDFLQKPGLQQEVFGPFSMLVSCSDKAELIEVINALEGQLTGSLIAAEEELASHQEIASALAARVGRILFNGVPTGVEVCTSMHHGGPFPASSDSRFTSVGTDAIYRWVRPVAYQDWPQELLPEELKNENPTGIFRKVNGKLTDKSI